MKILLAALALSLAACSGSNLSSGIVEQAQQVELDSTPPNADPEKDEDDADARYATQLVVRLDDGRTVTLTYSGVRRFEAGQPVRVHVSETGAFVM
jgi:hypothetical protein